MTVGPPTPVTALADREVYAADGYYVGRVVDIVVELETSERPALALQDVNESVVGTLPDDAVGIRIPYRAVRAVDDIVVLSKPVGEASGVAAAANSPSPADGRPGTEERSPVEARSDDIRDEPGHYGDAKDGIDRGENDRDGDIVP